MTITGTTPISLRAWFEDLTYQEVHATTWGFGLAALATNTESTTLAMAIVGLTVYAFGEKKAKQKDVDLVDVPEYVKEQVRRESHYFFGGVFAGVVVGGTTRMLGLAFPAVGILPT